MDDDFQEVYFPVLDRMVAAGLLSAWSLAGGKLELTWSVDFLGHGPADQVFLKSAQVLSSLFPERGPTEAEFATLLDLAGRSVDE